MRTKDLNFNTDEEQESVELIFNQALDILKEEDRGLNFIESLLPLLKRGIGVHHSGLLPILKEVIELLFQEHLIKVSKLGTIAGTNSTPWDYQHVFSAVHISDPLCPTVVLQPCWHGITVLHRCARCTILGKESSSFCCTAHHQGGDTWQCRQ